MSFSLIPDLLLPGYGDLTPQMLAERGIRLLLCDLDYTLAPRYVPRPDDRLRAWLAEMKGAGVRVPSPRGYRQAMEKAGVTARQTAMLGDKLLTDVLGANRSGVWAVMVEPMGGPRGAWNHVLHGLQRPFKALCRNRKEAKA